MPSRYKVGVLSEWNPSAYSNLMRENLEREAQRVRVELGFLGVEWANSDQVDDDALGQTQSWAEDYDALILISGVFSHGVSGLSRFCQRWAPRPVVSVGYRLPAVPSLLVDNRDAMRSATSHLIVTHERRKLVFLRGRMDSQESEERYLGFRHALREHRLLHDDRRLLTGDFTRRGALRALSKLNREVEFDGLLAANDDMALAVMDELARRNIRVPQDVAVVGFDDVSAARTAPVPLSSLAQPFEEMARHAFATVEKLWEGEQVDAARAVPVKFIARASCGCS